MRQHEMAIVEDDKYAWRKVYYKFVMKQLFKNSSETNLIKYQKAEFVCNSVNEVTRY